MHHLLDSRHLIFQQILFFSIYSAAGWILEVGYRSFHQRGFVNAGFLRGPFVPIYGVGASCVLLLAPWLKEFGWIVEFICFGVALTAIEYGIGTLCEKCFGILMWDYSDDPLNFRGRVCVPFSLVWALVAMAFVHGIHPHVQSVVQSMRPSALQLLAPLLVAYFVLDFAISVSLLYNLVDQLSRIYQRHTGLSRFEQGRLSKSFQRLLAAFPDLRKYLEAASDLRSRIDNRLSSLQLRFLHFLESRMPQEEEFRCFVRDIAVHPEFLRTKDFRHHDSSIYRHALRVSMLSYRVGKFLHLDARAMARGGLLHDFFLYDWRDHDLPELAKEKFHGFEHPRIALANATRHFALSPVEQDIITKHMWPLTTRPPRHLESMMVCCVDKVVATREFWYPVRKPTLTATTRSKSDLVLP